MDFDKSETILTLDVDWAPDFVIDYVSTMIKKFKIKTTWFITHDSPATQRLMSETLFEIGIHPNFANNSTQGDGVDNILQNLKRIASDATSIRTHGLLQSSAIISRFNQHGIDTDVSLFLDKQSSIKPHYSKNFKLTRIPYFWEDDVEMEEDVDWNNIKKYDQISGLKIYNFHPIHIFLNSYTFEKYGKIKNMNYSNIDESKLSSQKNEGFGTETFFKLLLESLKNKNTFTINDISQIFNNSK